MRGLTPDVANVIDLNLSKETVDPIETRSVSRHLRLPPLAQLGKLP